VIAVDAVERGGVSAELLVAAEPLALGKEEEVIVAEEVVLVWCTHVRGPFVSGIDIMQFIGLV
jgi:hypothetical protein